MGFHEKGKSLSMNVLSIPHVENIWADLSVVFICYTRQKKKFESKKSMNQLVVEKKNPASHLKKVP